MEEKEILLKKLENEMQNFHEGLLTEDKEVILENAYKKEVIFMMYTVLCELIEGMPNGIVRGLVNSDTKILEMLYFGWLKKEDSFQDELREHVLEEIKKEVLRQKGNIYG